MKRIIYISGVISINLILLGCILKIMHQPFGGIALTLGISTFCLLVLPLALINNYKGRDVKNNRLLYIVVFFTVFVDFMGMLFKVMHWPGANKIMIIALPLPFVLFLPVFIYQYSKQTQKSVRNLLGVMFLMLYIAVMSVFLSLSVSKNVLDGFIVNTYAQADTYNFLKARNAAYYENLSDKSDMLALEHKTDSLCEYIEKLKSDLLSASQNNMENSTEKNIWKIKNKDDKEIASEILVTNEEETLNSPADKLRDTLIQYKVFVAKWNNPELNAALEKLLDTSGKLKYGNRINWEENSFSGKPLVDVLAYLTQLQTNIRMIEWVLLN